MPYRYQKKERKKRLPTMCQVYIYISYCQFLPKIKKRAALLLQASPKWARLWRHFMLKRKIVIKSRKICSDSPRLLMIFFSQRALDWKGHGGIFHQFYERQTFRRIWFWMGFSFLYSWWVVHSMYYAAPFLQNRLGTKEKTTLQWRPKMAKSAMKISRKKKLLLF